MARIHIESDDELPELADLLRPKASRQRAAESSPKKSQPQSTSAKDECVNVKSKQRLLRKPEASQSLFGPIDASLKSQPTKLEARRTVARSSPRKTKASRPIEVFQDEKKIESCCEEDDGSSSSAHDSYHFSGGSSDEESWLEPKKDQESPFKKLLKSQPESSLKQTGAKEGIEFSNPFLGPRITPPLFSKPAATSSRPTSSSSALDNAAILHYTPPKRVSPSKKQGTVRSSTPPPEEAPRSPSKKLNSPTKSGFASIPQAGIRESLDAFWSQDVVNDWNEQYSPRKMVASPRKNRFATPTSEDENNPPSPSTSPRKSCSPQKSASPVKSKAARDMKKAWDVRKQELAPEFLHELDQKIAGGKLAELTASTGGVQIVWSKKLNTTAGRANWKREKIRDAQPDGTTVSREKHTAYIELAEKVIDDEDRLINVIAHEFCHLCNFMINGVRDNPHGKGFKEWAKKVTRSFGNRGIEVTTKHSYEIDYKYIWECMECSIEFKRHSKSIDTTKQACGACKGRLVQTKPAVCGKAAARIEYQLFVKEHCQRLKKENPGVAHGAIMEMLGKMYREQKAKRQVSSDAALESKPKRKEKLDIDSMVKELEVITLDD